MRLLIPITILLMSAASSCRTTKQRATSTADSTAVEVTAAKESVSVDDMLSVINASTDIELSGITVEFFQPDTVRPGIRANPRRLKIARAKACNDTKAARHEVAVVNDKDSVNVNFNRTTATAKNTWKEYDMQKLSDWVIPMAILAAIAIAIALLVKRTRH